MDEKMAKFLDLVPTANWRLPPAVWSEQLQAALSDNLVTVGWGGVLKLTEDGKRQRSTARENVK